MRTIKLLTGHRDHVARVKIAPFPKLPPIVIWGERFFYRDPALHDDAGKVPEYVETFAVACEDTTPERPEYIARGEIARPE